MRTHMVGNETIASQIFWRGLDRNSILDEIEVNSRQSNEAGRRSEGYSYAISQQAAGSNIRVMGDKVWNPATLLLHGDVRLGVVPWARGWGTRPAA